MIRIMRDEHGDPFVSVDDLMAWLDEQNLLPSAGPLSAEIKLEFTQKLGTALRPMPQS